MGWHQIIRFLLPLEVGVEVQVVARSEADALSAVEVVVHFDLLAES